MVSEKNRAIGVHEFPSPVGELRFSIDWDGIATKNGYVFPSPVGELRFSILNTAQKDVREVVSVPCRGATFLNGKGE